jgi:hypothetical protein
VKAWRWLTVMLAALCMGTTWAHLLEMPAKIRLDGATWLMLLQTVYPPAFGTVGAFFEIAAPIAAAVLAFLVRGQPAFRWTLFGALCLIAADAAFWIWVAPVNATLVPLTADTLPPDWTALRDQWEYTHAARALLQLTGLGFLVFSVVSEKSRRPVDFAGARSS